MIRYLRLWGHFFLNSLSRELEYKSHFITMIIVDVVWYTTQIALFEIIFLHTNTIGGFTKPEMTIFLGIFFLSDSINEFLFAKNFWSMSENVTKGDLDFYLIKPVSTTFMVLFRYVYISALFNIIGCCILIGWGISMLPTFPTSIDIGKFLLVFIAGNSILLSLQILLSGVIVTSIAGESIVNSFYSTFQIAGKPDTIFSYLLRKFFFYVFPMTLIASLPTKALLSQVGVIELVSALAIATIYFIGSSKFFMYSLRKYSGASA
jgi:ABC-2 type transport system permease protein